MDIASLLSFKVSAVELVVRGTVMYWFLLLLFRFVLRRDMGALGAADVLFIVIVADAAQNGFSGGYDSVAEAFVLVGTLAAWNYLIDRASYRYAWVRRLTEAPPVLLVRDGRYIMRNLRQESVSREEMEAQLREAGVASVEEVREARMESDGKLSVLTYHDKPPPRRNDKHPAV